MKSKSDVIYKLPLLVSLCALLVAVPLRVYQYFKVLEPETGFYSTIDFSVYIIYALLGIAVITAIVIPLINRKKMITVASVKKSPVFLVLSLILAVTIIIDSAGQLMSYFDLYDAAASSGSTIAEYVKKQGGTLLLLQAVSGAIAAVYFFVSGLSVSLGNSDGSKLKLLGLTPVLWCIFRLLYKFKRTISFINVSDLLLCFLPRFILMVTGKSELLNDHYGVSYSDLGAAAYIIYNLLSRAKAQTSEPEE